MEVVSVQLARGASQPKTVHGGRKPDQLNV
jgi:hypothetical protein